jgi:hypothetical protein
MPEPHTLYSCTSTSLSILPFVGGCLLSEDPLDVLTGPMSRTWVESKALS